MSKKSLEQRLYEALRRCSGCSLSAQDVHDLVWRDDAVQTRINNVAGQEGGEDCDRGLGFRFGIQNMPTWAQLKRRK